MSRIPAVDPAHADPKAQGLLQAVHKSLGVTPNLFKVVAQSPAALEGLLGLNGALGHGKLGPKVRESISLAIAESNGCHYCLSAHTLLGKGAGLSDSDVDAAREGGSADAKTAAIIRFARLLVDTRGHVAESDLAALRSAGLGDAEIVEVVANTVLNILTNYINNVAATDIDFPLVRAPKAA